MSLAKMSEYAKLEIVNETENDFEFLLTDGFSGTIDDTISLTEICKSVAFGYGFIKLFKTDIGLFHLILTKTAKK